MNGSRRGIGGGILLFLAGGVIVTGVLLDWFDVATGAIGFEGGRVDASYSGIQAGALGWVALVAGGLVALAGLIWIASRVGRAPSIVAAIAGLVAAAVGAYELSQLDQAFIDVAASNAANDQLPAEKISDLLTRLIDAGQVSVDPGIGLYLVLAGGLVAGIFGLIGVFRAGNRDQSDAYEPPAFTVPDEKGSHPVTTTDAEPEPPAEPVVPEPAPEAHPALAPEAPNDSGEWR